DEEDSEYPYHTYSEPPQFGGDNAEMLASNFNYTSNEFAE
ncbi:8808_t:CDS:1, partial [Gigaspora rosea]